jgi:hypothetical protein
MDHAPIIVSLHNYCAEDYIHAASEHGAIELFAVRCDIDHWSVAFHLKPLAYCPTSGRWILYIAQAYHLGRQSEFHTQHTGMFSMF